MMKKWCEREKEKERPREGRWRTICRNVGSRESWLLAKDGKGGGG